MRLRSSLTLLALGVAVGFGVLVGSSRSSNWSQSRLRPIKSPTFSGQVLLRKRTFSIGEPIEVAFAVKNLSRDRITYFVTDFGNTHQIVIKNRAGSEPEYTPEGSELEKNFGTPNRRANVPIELDPGQSFVEADHLRLDQIYQFRPDVYRLQIRFFDAHPGVGHILSTSPIEFEVRAN